VHSSPFLLVLFVLCTTPVGSGLSASASLRIAVSRLDGPEVLPSQIWTPEIESEPQRLPFQMMLRKKGKLTARLSLRSVAQQATVQPSITVLNNYRTAAPAIAKSGPTYVIHDMNPTSCALETPHFTGSPCLPGTYRLRLDSTFGDDAVLRDCAAANFILLSTHLACK